jgi:hypothetical protein
MITIALFVCFLHFLAETAWRNLNASDPYQYGDFKFTSLQKRRRDDPAARTAEAALRNCDMLVAVRLAGVLNGLIKEHAAVTVVDVTWTSQIFDAYAAMICQRRPLPFCTLYPSSKQNIWFGIVSLMWKRSSK